MAKIFLTIILLLIFIQGLFALSAESDSYSVARFGVGVQASDLASDNLEAHSILLANAGTRNAESGGLLVNIGFWSNTPYYTSVSITSYSISPKSAVIGSTIGLYVSALNSQNVWAKITSPNNQEQTLILINNQFVNYLPSPSVVGRYNVTFYANSSTGAIASAVDYFELTEQTTPSTPPSGGGGGSTIIEKSCTYNWDCTPWSLCSEGKQKRECKNIGTCNGTESKPKEEINCSEALFDIFIKLNDVNLTQNKTLKFNVSLIEKTGNEKIDVHVKYSVIDDNNTEIFSQIETKAIKKDLTYEKEINEINLSDGEYILRVDVLYGNLQRAFAEQKFNVGGGKIARGTTPNILGRVISELSPINNKISLVSLIVLLVIILLILLRKKIILIYKRIIEFLSEIINKNKKYPSSSIKGLINKKVYSNSGHYMGKVKDVILGENKIESLKIKIHKKHKFKSKGVIINYKQVKSVSEVVIVSEKVLEYIENYGNI